MDQNQLINLIKAIHSQKISPEAALEKLKFLSFEPLGNFANLDHQRALRTGMPEVIFAQGKTANQLLEIFLHMAAQSGQVLATRVTPDIYMHIRQQLPSGCNYNELGRTLTFYKDNPTPKKPGILILTAGTADIPIAEEAADSAEIMGHSVEKIYDVGVAGLHRLMAHLPALQKAHVIIVAAGMEGALPSVVGGLVAAPVIAVPTSVGYGTNFGGLTALLAMLNSCANGIAVVNIDNGFGAACLAARINRAFETHVPS